MIGGLGWQELLIVLVIVALVFGASRVAGLGGALGKGIREFRTEANASDDADGDAQAAAPAKDAPAAAAESAEAPKDGEQSG